MRRPLVPVLLLAASLGACVSPSGPPADRVVYRTEDAASPRLEAPSPRDVAQQPGQERPAASIPGPVRQMTDAERIQWFRDRGIYPVAWRPAPGTQDLGYVEPRTDWGPVVDTVITLGALYGLYRLKRHYDW